jgi:glutamate/tyrosine decarboxylase-like PLP-dependent enzyme
MPLEELIADVTEMLERWSVQVSHPRYFGLFNPSVTAASVVADTLVAAYNPQLAAWSHAAAANEIERFTLDLLMRRFGLDPASSIANFTTGGAEANMSALLAALVHRFPELPTEGLQGLPSRPLVFVTEQSHHSVAKAAQMAGLGQASVRHVAVSDDGAMNPAALADRLSSARAAGAVPCFVVATAGSTSTGIIDPLAELRGRTRRTPRRRTPRE